MPKRRKLSEDLAELAPEVQDIPSLIEIAQRKVEYQNLDSQTLWKILPELKKLNNMIYIAWVQLEWRAALDTMLT